MPSPQTAKPINDVTTVWSPTTNKQATTETTMPAYRVGMAPNRSTTWSPARRPISIPR